MHKIIYILVFLTGISFSSCKKERIFPQEENATIVWGGSPEVDGTGWVIKTDGGKIYHSDDLTSEFKVDGLRVEIEYRETKKEYVLEGGSLVIIKIKEIEKI